MPSLFPKLLHLVVIAFGEMAILTIFLQLQDNIKLIRRYEGWRKYESKAYDQTTLNI